MASFDLFKVIILDADMKRQLLIRDSAAWRDLKCDIVAYAQQQTEARRLYQEIRPNIILLGMLESLQASLDFVRWLRQVDRDVQVLLFADDFSYSAMRAYIRYGVNDVLLIQSLTKEMVTNALEEAKNGCRRLQQLAQDQQSHAIRELQQCFLLHKEERSDDSYEFEQVLRLPHFDFMREGAIMLYLRIDQIHLIHHQNMMPRFELRRLLEQALVETRPDSLYTLSFFLSQHSAIVLFHTTDIAQVRFWARRLLTHAQQLLQLSVSAAISGVFHDAAGMQNQFDALIENMGQCFYQKDHLLDHSVSVPLFQPLRMEELSYHLDLQDAYIRRDFAAVRQLMQEIFAYVREHWIEPKDVRAYFCFILHVAQGYEISLGSRQRFLYQDVSEVLLLCETLDMLEQVLFAIWNDIEQWVHQKGQEYYRPDVSAWLEYIHRHLDRPLTLREVAGHFQLSESYVSRLFRKETGKNMIYYINEQKIKQTLPLLENTTLPIQVIAERAGIRDPLYFNRLFHRFQKMSPSEYRKRMRSSRS